ncbi:hypothetical protein GXP67_28385 [Rhodocytophaga rosea]|uniref:Uncharacterized protein n=1 Tax=Rhodocytophaga rosea TaxID=2704465 RepID=A0A6C0GQF2_9BACT|nr:hypothetical protein [Rhodocytophaga rosea]QHT70291.1 hypothetical protein GXP67_28385 [Rhodocytophaga rosea]
MINIVTCICVDKDDKDESVYPRMNYRTSQQRRLIYWKCAAVSFATSIRCNPGIRHILYTNDHTAVRYKGHDLRAFLTDLGVEIRYLPFEIFKPFPGVSKKFRNAFYKLDVISELGKHENEYNVLLDSDCVWVKNSLSFFQAIDHEKLLVYDCYQRTDPYEKRSGLNRMDLGEMFNRIDPAYPVAAPIHYGREIIGGNGRMFREISNQMHQFFRHVLQTYGNDPPRFPNGNSIFDYEEYVTSFVYNKMPDRLIEAGDLIHRVAAPYQKNSLAAMNYTIWHLLAEKRLGFMFLFKKVFDLKSAFWKIPLDNLDEYISKHMGVSRRKSVIEKYLVRVYKAWYAAQFIVRRKLRKLSF